MIIHWLIIAIFLIVGIVALRMDHLKHRVLLLMLIFFALFVYLTMTMVAKENNIDFSSKEGIITAVRVYLGWLANSYENIKSLVGRAIDMDWTSTDGSFFR